MALTTEERQQFAVDGSVARTEPGTDDHHVELARRYLPPDRVERYPDFARSELGDNVVIYLRPQHWLSADPGEV